MGDHVKTAKEISEEILEITGKALLSNDFDSFEPCFRIPHFISSSEDKATINTREEMRAMFGKLVEYYTLNRVTELVRIIEVSEYRTPTRIEATHITHVMSGNQRLGDSFPCYSILEFIDGHWQVINSQYAVDANTTVGYALTSKPLKPSEEQTEIRNTK
ncbi:hypothetical protein [Sulfitobacter undariae]|nr:hypothetical protein [Sulfitobacter undariae]